MITTSPFRKQGSEGSLFPPDSEKAGQWELVWFRNSATQLIRGIGIGNNVFQGQVLHSFQGSDGSHPSSGCSRMLPLVVVVDAGVVNGRAWKMVILNLDIKSIALSPSVPFTLSTPGLGDVQCPGVSTGCNLGHLGSSSRSPPDPRITWVMPTLLDFRLLSVK